MFDLLKLGSKFMKGMVAQAIMNRVEKTYGVRLDLVLDDFEIKHCKDNCAITFKVAAQGSMSEKDFRSVVEKALK